MEKNDFNFTCLVVIRRKWVTPPKKVKYFFTKRGKGKAKQERCLFQGAI